MTADYIVWVTCCVLSVFYVGYEVGAQNRPTVCPEATGQQVISTILSKTEQICVYERTYGPAQRKARL